jgi:hypothetical protein
MTEEGGLVHLGIVKNRFQIRARPPIITRYVFRLLPIEPERGLPLC